MIQRRITKGGKVRYAVRITVNGEQKWIGTYAKLKGEMGAEKAERRALDSPARSKMTAQEFYEDVWLPHKVANGKANSAATHRTRMAPFLKDHGKAKLSDLERMDRDDAIEWAAGHQSHSASVVTFFNDAIDRDKISRNPFRGLGTRGEGRKNLTPMEPEEVQALADAAFKAYVSKDRAFATSMRAFVLFMAYTASRTAEMFGFEWGDIDFENMEGRVWRQRTQTELELPKGERRRPIALLPEARDALLPLTNREGAIFTSKTGKLLSHPLLSWYWPKIESEFGRDVDPYELRHFGGHHFYVRLDYQSRVVAAQMGNSPRKVEDLYGHFKHGAIDEIKRTEAARGSVVQLREAK